MPSKDRSYAVTVRFSGAEKKKLEDVANRNGITISDVIRMCVNRVHASGEFMDLSSPKNCEPKRRLRVVVIAKPATPEGTIKQKGRRR